MSTVLVEITDPANVPAATEMAKRIWAYSIQYFNLCKELRPLLSGIEDPYITWQALERHFRPSNSANIVESTDQFFECKLQPSEELNLYGARLRDIIIQLKDAVVEFRIG